MILRGLITMIAALALTAPVFAATDPRRDEQWGLSMVEGPGAWPTSTGVGAIVAVIDTGIAPNHPDLEGRLLPGFDFVGADPDQPGDTDTDPTDGNGHGTHVSGIVAAVAGNGEGIAGVAPGAHVLPLRVLDDNGEGFADDTTKAINRAIDGGADVINLSLGDAIPLQSTLFGDPEFESALNRAIASDIVVVLAAGNNGLPLCENPKVDGILCVGSVDNRGLRSGFSSFGSDVDLMGPGGSAAGGSGEDVLSTWLRGRYEAVAGTSQATPHVSGVAALLVSLGVRGEAAAKRIIATAKDAGAAGPDDQYGAGIVNAKAAVAGLGPPPPKDPETPTGTFFTRATWTVRRVEKRGISVTCKAVRPGQCRVSVYYKRERIAKGRGDVPASDPTPVVTRLTKTGKKRLARVKKSIRVTVHVALPGEAPRTREITIKR